MTVQLLLRQSAIIDADDIDNHVVLAVVAVAVADVAVAAVVTVAVATIDILVIADIDIDSDIEVNKKDLYSICVDIIIYPALEVPFISV